MKTIIFYATKYGAAEEIAQKIASKTDGAVVHNLSGKDAIPSIDEFGCVIIGSSLYVGTIRKEAKEFLAKNAEALKKKNVGLFLSGLEQNKENEFFEMNFSAQLLQTAKAKCLLGGIFDPKKASGMERLMLKMVAKMVDYVNTIDDAKIEEFVRAVRGE